MVRWIGWSGWSGWSGWDRGAGTFANCLLKKLGGLSGRRAVE
jgi:hypothetical protein